MTLNEALSMRIESREDAESFLRALHELKLHFHLDDSAASCFDENSRCLSLREARSINAQYERKHVSLSDRAKLDAQRERVFACWQSTNQHDDVVSYFLSLMCDVEYDATADARKFPDCLCVGCAGFLY